MTEYFCLQNGNKVPGNIVEKTVRELSAHDEVAVYLANIALLPAPWHLLRITCPESLKDDLYELLSDLALLYPDGVHLVRWFFLSPREYQGVQNSLGDIH